MNYCFFGADRGFKMLWKRLVHPRRPKILFVLSLVVLVNFTILSLLRFDAQDTLLNNLQDLRQALQQNGELPAEFVRKNLFGVELIPTYEVPEVFIADPPLVYDFDPRLTLAVYLNLITRQYAKHQDLTKVEVPFSWYDWTYIGEELNKYIDVPNHKKFGCSLICVQSIRKAQQMDIDNGLDELRAHKRLGNSFLQRRNNQGDETDLLKWMPELQVDKKIEEEVRQSGQVLAEATSESEREAIREIGRSSFRPRRKSVESRRCPEYCREDRSIHQPGFIFFKDLLRARPNVKALQAASYLYSVAPTPLSLVITTETGNIKVGIKPNDGSDKQKFNIFSQGLIRDTVASRNSQKLNVSHEFQDLLKSVAVTKSQDAITYEDYQVELQHERFLFDAPAYLSQNTNPIDKREIIFQQSLKDSLGIKEELLNKHFQEVRIIKNTKLVEGAHHDWRFFNNKAGNSFQQNEILSRMARTWFRFTANAGILSWLSHGGLLSHDINGMMFPWDDDLDLQMPYADLVKLAKNFNNSLILENPNEGYGAYYLEVTGSITHRVNGNGLNHIDARFIDVKSGLFIDITGLAVSASSIPGRYEEAKNKTDLSEILHRDPNYVLPSLYEAMTKEEQKQRDDDFLRAYHMIRNSRQRKKFGITSHLSADEKFDLNYKMKLYNCRNDHFYQLSDLSPLKLSYFEKFPIYTPNKISDVLDHEYLPQVSLYNVYKNHVYIPQLRIWIEKNILNDNIEDQNKLLNGNWLTEGDVLKLLENENVLKEFMRSYDGTLLREKEKFLAMDNDIPNRDALIKELLKDRKFKPAGKDMFMESLEERRRAKIDVTGALNTIVATAKKQAKSEYEGKADYNIIGSLNSRSDTDFGQVGWDSKQLVKLYQEGKFDPDFSIKLNFLQRELLKAGASKVEEVKQELLALMTRGKAYVDNRKPGDKIPNFKVAGATNFDPLSQSQGRQAASELMEQPNSNNIVE